MPVDVKVDRRRGRPRVTEPRTSVSTWVPASTHDKLVEIAQKREISISSLVKTLVQRELKQP